MLRTCLYVRIYLSICDTKACGHMYVCILMYGCMYVRINAHVYIDTYGCMYVHMYMRACKFMCT